MIKTLVPEVRTFENRGDGFGAGGYAFNFGGLNSAAIPLEAGDVL